jgi:hypothetical protein
LTENLHRPDRLAHMQGTGLSSAADVRRTEDRPLILDLDQLPYIAPIYKRFFKVEHYYFNLSYHPMVMLIGGRGCNSLCFYCVYPQVITVTRIAIAFPNILSAKCAGCRRTCPRCARSPLRTTTLPLIAVFARRLPNGARTGRAAAVFRQLRTTVDYETLKHCATPGCATAP